MTAFYALVLCCYFHFVHTVFYPLLFAFVGVVVVAGGLDSSQPSRTQSDTSSEAAATGMRRHGAGVITALNAGGVHKKASARSKAEIAQRLRDYYRRESAVREKWHGLPGLPKATVAQKLRDLRKSHMERDHLPRT